MQPTDHNTLPQLISDPVSDAANSASLVVDNGLLDLHKLKLYRLSQIILPIIIILSTLMWLFLIPFIALFSGLFIWSLLVALPFVSIVAQAIVLIIVRKHDAWFRTKFVASSLLLVLLVGISFGLVSYMQSTSVTSLPEWAGYAIATLLVHVGLWFVIGFEPKVSNYTVKRNSVGSLEQVKIVKRYYARLSIIMAVLAFVFFIFPGIIVNFLNISEDQITNSITGLLLGAVYPGCLALCAFFVIRRGMVK